MTKNRLPTKNIGINELNDFVTIGGTPSGILIIHPFLLKNINNNEDKQPIIIATKRPLAPSQSNPIAVIILSCFVVICSNGVTIINETNAVNPPAHPSKPSSFVNT